MPGTVLDAWDIVVRKTDKVLLLYKYLGSRYYCPAHSADETET